MLKSGDLVIVKRPTPCCANTKAIGRVFTVDRVKQRLDSICLWCGARSVCAAVTGQEGGLWIEASRLVRIDPSAEQEDIDTGEALHA